jgi:uncharacterized membrane protein
MTKRVLVFVSSMLIAAMIVSGWVAGQLAPGATLPVHWNARGEADNFAGKWMALMLPALLAIGTTILLAMLGLIQPMRENFEKSRGLYHTIWIGLLGLFGLIHLMVLDAALHWHLPAPRLLVGALGLFFVAIGNQLGKSRPMFFIGIRTPWTLTNQDVWIATHRLGGKLMVLAGAVWVVAALGDWTGPRAMPVLTTTLLAACLIPAAYSYLFWRHLQRKPN